jgi:hypothetical protein
VSCWGLTKIQSSLCLLPAPLPPLLSEPFAGRSHPTFSRQAANLWKVKERLWQQLLAQSPHDPTFALCDSLPLAVCLFARAYRCRRFKGEAAFGKDTLLKQSFYGFRVHIRVCWPGVISRISVAPANAHELSVLPEIVEGTSGLIIAERNYHSPKTKQELAGIGVELVAPYFSKKRDPTPKKSALLSRLRYRIDTVFSQLTERYSLKKVWARDLWHLTSRLLRKVLSHTQWPSCSIINSANHPYSSPSCSSEKPAHRVS